VELLDDETIDRELAGREWRREGDEIVREWKLSDFGAAIAFVNLVAEAAESADHHPDILIHGWNRVRISVSTHSAGGLTESDLALARSIDGLPAEGQ
jgi:4a-hydroxytetrahydrobiopterin dehydratase